MKRFAGIFCAAGLLAGAALQAQETASAKNPVVEKFSNSLVFYASMDGTANAELSVGDGKPNAAPPATAFVPGLYGKAIQSGNFDLAYLIPRAERMTRSGAAALWVARAPGARHDSGYFFFLNLSGNGRTIMLARMGDPRNREALYAYIQDGGIGHSCGAGSTLDWKEREWHLLVMNWRSDSVELSLDGQAPSQARLQHVAPEPSAEKLRDERLGVSSMVKSKDADGFLLNELMLFNAPLTAEEIRNLYETSRKN